MFSSSIIGEVLKLLPRDLVSSCVGEHRSDRWRKHFKTWDHLVALVVAQLSEAGSLRDLETVLNQHEKHHYHLHTGPLRRSTLSDANQGRSYEVFRDIALALMEHQSRRSSELKNLVTVLDSSQITLRGRGKNWARKQRTRSNHSALKLHVQYDHDSQYPSYVEVSDVTVNDVVQAQGLSLDSNRIYVFDKGYCDYNWWKRIADTEARFVTRLKRNAAFKAVETRSIEEEDQGLILKDQVIELTNKTPRAGAKNELAGIPLRLIEIKHPAGKDQPFWIVSNDLKASAAQIAGWYKQRWSIELLFKWLKQNLKIKSFIGESRNAILIQLFCAIIA